MSRILKEGGTGMELGQTLIDLAETHGISHTRLAKLTGLSKGAVSEIARGMRPLPATAAGAIAVELGLDAQMMTLAAVVSQAKPDKRPALAELLRLPPPFRDFVYYVKRRVAEARSRLFGRRP